MLNNIRSSFDWFSNVLKLIGLFILYQLTNMPEIIATREKGLSFEKILAAGVASLVLMGLLIWLMVVVYRNQKPIVTKLIPPKKPMLTLVFLFMLIEIGNLLIDPLIKQTPENQAVLQKVFATSPITSAISMVLLAPVIEELLFRGLLYRWLFPRLRTWTAFILTLVLVSFLFAFAHTLSLNLALLAYLLLSCVLTLTYVWFNDIRYSIGLHCINNLIAVIGMIILL